MKKTFKFSVNWSDDLTEQENADRIRISEITIDSLSRIFDDIMGAKFGKDTVVSLIEGIHYTSSLPSED